jgi:hypothetical protein
MWLLEPAPIQTTGCASSVRSMKTEATRGSGKGATAPGSNPVASRTSSVPAIRAVGLPAASAIFVASARRSPGTSTTTVRPAQSKTSDFTICERLQPMARAASTAVGVPSANSSTRTSAPASRK